MTMKRRGFLWKRTPQSLHTLVEVIDEQDAECDAMADLPGDVEAAFLVLRRKALENLPSNESLAQEFLRCPFVLLPHISSIIEDKSAIERDIEILRRRNKLRCFRLTNTTDVALCLTSDYLVAGAFIASFSDLVEQSTALSAPHDVAEQALSKPSKRQRLGGPHVSISTKPAGEKEAGLTPVDRAVRAGFLRVREADRSSNPVRFSLPDDALIRYFMWHLLFILSMCAQGLWFSASHLGAFSVALVCGRQELVAILARFPRKERLFSDLCLRRLRSSWLGISFHVTDLLVRGDVMKLETARGSLVRLKRGR